MGGQADRLTASALRADEAQALRGSTPLPPAERLVIEVIPDVHIGMPDLDAYMKAMLEILTSFGVPLALIRGDYVDGSVVQLVETTVSEAVQ